LQRMGSWAQSMPASETAHNQKAVHQERGQDEGQRRAISTAGVDGGQGAAGLMRAPDRVSGMRRSNTVGAPDRVTGEGYLRRSISGGGVLGGGASSSRGEYEARDAKGGTGGGGEGDKARQQRKRCLPMPASRCGYCPRDNSASCPRDSVGVLALLSCCCLDCPLRLVYFLFGLNVT
jgi:hypothetical protein